MTDQKPDQPGGDGLLPCPFCGSTSSGAFQRDNAWRVECGKCGNGTAFHGQRGVAVRYWNTRATRDGAEGAGELSLKNLPNLLIGIQEDLPNEDHRNVLGAAAHFLRKLTALPNPPPAPCGCKYGICNGQPNCRKVLRAEREAREAGASVPPQPAPDAMREALLQQSRRVLNYSNPNEVFEAVPTKFIADTSELPAPVPPADGAREILDSEEKYLLEHFDADCGLMPGDIEGSFHRLLEVLLSPSGTGAAEPVAQNEIHSSGSGVESKTRKELSADPQSLIAAGNVDSLGVAPGLPDFNAATPPVRGGREAIVHALLYETGMFDSPEEIAANPDHPTVQAAYRVADRLSLPVQPGAGEREEDSIHRTTVPASTPVRSS